MEKVLEKIQELYDALVQATGTVTASNAAIEKRAGELNAMEEKQAEMRADLDAREIKVAEVEDIIRLKEEGMAIRRENIAKEQQFINEKSELVEDIRVKNSNVNKRMAEVVSQDDRIEKEWNLIKQERAQLNKDKEDYKNDVIKDILKQKG